MSVVRKSYVTAASEMKYMKRFEPASKCTSLSTVTTHYFQTNNLPKSLRS